MRSPTSSRRRDSLRRQIRAAMAYPMMIGVFALVVLLALVAFLIPVFEEVFKDFDGKLPAITQISVGMSHFVTGQWYLLIADHGRHRLRASRSGRSSSWGQPPVGRDQAEDPGQDRRRDPQDRARALVAHLLRPRARRRADPAGDRDHRQDRRQRPHRARDGRREASPSSAAARSPSRCARARCSRRWSPTWSASARRPETWTACSARSPTSTRTRWPP